jgi:Fe-S oxidoreductase
MCCILQVACHQTPAIKKAMQSLLSEAVINYWFMDETGGFCCGRPMMLAGHKEQADLMIGKNRRIILESGAKTLVTSCPICYKVFAKDYDLNIRIVHHTQYLLELEQRAYKLEPWPVALYAMIRAELSRDFGICGKLLHKY